MKSKCKSDSRKGFTIVELLTVISVLGILVLIAAPKFLGYTEKAHLSHIKADIKTIENSIDSKLLVKDDLLESWEDVDDTVLRSGLDERKLYNKKKLLTTEPENIDSFKKIDLKSIQVNSNLEGEFLFNKKTSETLYLDKKTSSSKPEETTPSEENPNEEPITPDKPEETTPSEENPNEGPITPEENSDYSDDEWEWIDTEEWGAYNTDLHKYTKGYYHYIGNKTTVVIPKKIHNDTVIHYYKMFEGTSVSKVISNNTVGSMNLMFDNSTAEHLDLSEVTTTTAWGMDSMFESAEAKTIDISGFDTSKVKTMIQMFNNAKVDTVIFGNKFSSASLLDFEGMFDGKKKITLKFPQGTTIPKWMKNYYEMNYVYY